MTSPQLTGHARHRRRSRYRVQSPIRSDVRPDFDRRISRRKLASVRSAAAGIWHGHSCDRVWDIARRCCGRAGYGELPDCRARPGTVTGTPAGLPAAWTLTDGYLIGPRADLAGAHLAGQHLDGDNLSQAYLFSADLNGATVTGADLAEAVLVKANLTSADLSDADLASARLQNSTLAGTKLAGANLAGALTGGITGVPAVLPADWQLLGGSFGYLVGPGAYLQPATCKARTLQARAVSVAGTRQAFPVRVRYTVVT